MRLTVVVTADSGLHKGLHPLSDNDLLIMTEIICFVRVVNDPETVTTRVDVLVGDDLVADDVDISLDLCLLHVELDRYHREVTDCPTTYRLVIAL